MLTLRLRRTPSTGSGTVLPFTGTVLALTGTAIFNLINCTFNGDLTVTSPVFLHLSGVKGEKNESKLKRIFPA